jgi:hypothetical protein
MRRCLIPCLLLLIIMAACNLQPITAPTPTPYPTPQPLDVTPAGTLVIYVTATPFGVPSGSNSGIPEQSSDVANWILNGVFAPLWNMAGAQGGLIAQVIFCIIPTLLVILIAMRYVFYGRRR